MELNFTVNTQSLVCTWSGARREYRKNKFCLKERGRGSTYLIQVLSQKQVFLLDKNALLLSLKIRKGLKISLPECYIEL